MKYAEVAVDASIGHDRTLSYSIPPRMEIEPGQMVWVPLRSRPVQGIVIHLAGRPQVEATRDIISPIEPSPLVSPPRLLLARWLSRYYMSSLFDAVALMLPPGFQTRVLSYVSLAPQGGMSPDGDDLPPGCGKKDRPNNHPDTAEGKATEYLLSEGEVSEKDLVKALGKNGDTEVRRLLRRGVLRLRWELPRPRMSHRYECYLRLAAPPGQGEGGSLPGDKSPKQMALYTALASTDEPIPRSLLYKDYGQSAVKGLLSKGLLAQEWARVHREPALQHQKEAPPEYPIVPTPEQERALAEINAALDGWMDGMPAANPPFLLHGVTGSGKTEVYLRALEHCIAAGKRGIFLVPEIALTPQTVHRLNTRFPGRVAVLHSRLSAREQFDQWWRIRDGEYDVVVGPRSALFAPLPDLGLIVMDEEHEWSYKQQDAAPRYHTRTVALKLAEITGAVVVLGSATPDVESYYKGAQGEYRLLELPQRVAPASGPPGPSHDSRPSPDNGDTPVADLHHPLVREEASRVYARPLQGDLARVEVCDMRQELKDGNRSIFSRSLAEALQQCVDRGEQAILFLNRRGSSTVIQCRDCGFALRCGRCSVTLTYHAANMRLLCHHCNRRSRLPRSCPQCRSPRIRYLGLGTQRVSEELGRLLPNATALRWDRDTARAANAPQNIMGRFLRGEAQVLIGTQMVAKGLHVPGVTLVGVVLADIGLNIPDLRAGERAFQLLCQVAGRAGRGTSPGRAIIQTYIPDNYAVQAAAGQDYSAFYSQEIEFRHQYANPPFNRLVHMTYLHTNDGACRREAEKMGRTLRQRAYSLGLTDLEVVGPAPAFPERVRGRYRWHLILRGRNIHQFLEGINIPHDWTVDVDPVSVL